MPNVSASLIEDDRKKSNLGNAGGDQYDATSVKAALHSYKQTHALIGCLNKLLFFLFFYSELCESMKEPDMTQSTAVEKAGTIEENIVLTSHDEVID